MTPRRYAVLAAGLAVLAVPLVVRRPAPPGPPAREPEAVNPTLDPRADRTPAPPARPDPPPARAAEEDLPDPAWLRAHLEGNPDPSNWVARLISWANHPAADPTLRDYAAAALVRAGTPTALCFVLDELLEACRSENDVLADRMVAALESTTTAEGAQLLLDFLLQRGIYTGLEDPVPAEARAAVRKALLSQTDQEMVGALAANLYLDPEIMANPAAQRELGDGLSAPWMLAQLAVHAYAAGRPDLATSWLDRLQQSDEPAALPAMLDWAGQPAVPRTEALQALRAWVRAHDDESALDLLSGCLTDPNRPPEQRIMAASGLAISADRVRARQILTETLRDETDPALRQGLEEALSLLARPR